MIEIKPMSEQECIEANLIPKGIYPFVVLNTQEKSSPKIGSFLSLKLNIVLPANKLRTCFDALFFTEQMMWKTRHFYASTNMLNIYETGKFLAQDCDNAEGYLEISHRARKDTGELEHFVKDYIVAEKKAEKADEVPFLDDEIPNIN